MGAAPPKPSQMRKLTDCLMQIEGSKEHRIALEVATDDAARSAARIEQLVSRSEDMKKNVFQVVGFFLVFQSVLITVVSQASILHKDNLWSPLALSAAAGVGCFIPVWQYGKSIANLRGDLYDEEYIHQVNEKRRSELRRLGTGYLFPADEEPRSKKCSDRVYFKPYAVVLLFLICFTLLILISEWRILASEPAG